ncbi:hypothetical protein GCM10025881_17190 [Pseudolysinimonas kribbensis]|uniref:Uncharacterized protein n=1 Tax=Pseudolysinimonas kribbensis TaxID=433641 RepID=A0ABQ6K5M6_9MICO|nr:hypothetical protein GCM10025881_17190 [Pseudolysinimonas kribbensis]
MRGLLVGGFALGILLLVCGLVWGLTVDGIGSPMSQCVHALQNPTSGIAIPDGSTVSGGYSLTPSALNAAGRHRAPTSRESTFSLMVPSRP